MNEEDYITTLPTTETTIDSEEMFEELVKFILESLTKKEKVVMKEKEVAEYLGCGGDIRLFGKLRILLKETGIYIGIGRHTNGGERLFYFVDDIFGTDEIVRILDGIETAILSGA